MSTITVDGNTFDNVKEIRVVFYTITNQKPNRTTQIGNLVVIEKMSDSQCEINLVSGERPTITHPLPDNMYYASGAVSY